MTNIDLILERLRENEEIARKFNEVEIKVLSILNFADLFEVLLTEIRDQFKIPYTWISLVDNSEVSSLIRSLGSSETLRERMNIIERDMFFDLIGHSTKPILANTDLRPYFKLLPRNRKYFIKSIAVAPITLDGDIIGSLNQADFSQERFMPGIDTSLLEQLAVKVSLCLSNVTAHEKLRFLAYHDPLTGLLNRRVMETVLKREFNRAKRYDGEMSLVFIDLDYFKAVNDDYGHDKGDELLKFLADGLFRMSRESDIAARYAGDEFVLILPETGVDQARAQVDRLTDHFARNPLVTGGLKIPVSFSSGVVSIRDSDCANPDELLKRADEKLYEAKQNRKEPGAGRKATPTEGNVIPFRDMVAEKTRKTDSAGPCPAAPKNPEEPSEPDPDSEE